MVQTDGSFCTDLSGFLPGKMGNSHLGYLGNYFFKLSLTYETEMVLFLAVLENSVLPMG